MNDQRTTAAGDNFEDDVERAIEDRRADVLAADATGLIAAEVTPIVVEDDDDDSA